MKFTGKVKWIGQKSGGVSKAGNAWEKIEIVVEEAEGAYPSSMLFSAMNARINDVAGLRVGDTVTVDYTAHVRDYTDRSGVARHSMECAVYKVEMPQPAVDKVTAYMQQAVASAPAAEVRTDNLPF